MAPTTRTQCLLALDVGNTSVKGAWITRDAIRPVLRVPTRPVEDLPDRLRTALASPDLPCGLRCLVASVCPAADGAIAAALEPRARPEFFGRDLAVPLTALVRHPGRVGVDRLLLALAAREEAGAPCIVVSAGTAITVDLVDPEGRFAGGAIAPGLALGARALHASTALLPRVTPRVPATAVGTDTDSAVASGVYWACAGGVTALAARYRDLPGCDCAPLVCTGTDAPLLLGALPEPGTRHVSDLIFRGMARAVAAAAG